MKYLGTAFLAASGLLVAGTAAAEQPQWTYADIGYYQADSFGDDQTDGFTVNGDIAIMDLMHLGVGYINGSLGIGSINNDFDGYQIRFGVHPAINDSSQLVADAIYFDTSYDQSDTSSNIDRDGYGLGLGVRSMLTDTVETSVMAYWSYASFDSDDVDFDGDATTVSVVLGGRYHFTPAFSVGATVVVDEPIISAGSGSHNSMNLDLRWTFRDFSLGK